MPYPKTASKARSALARTYPRPVARRHDRHLAPYRVEGRPVIVYVERPRLDWAPFLRNVVTMGIPPAATFGCLLGSLIGNTVLMLTLTTFGSMATLTAYIHRFAVIRPGRYAKAGIIAAGISTGLGIAAGICWLVVTAVTGIINAIAANLPVVIAVTVVLALIVIRPFRSACVTIVKVTHKH